MTKQNERDECAVLQRRSHSGDEMEAGICSSDKAIFELPARDREAIHEFGCRIVARTLRTN
jgi:hypothetical protein